MSIQNFQTIQNEFTEAILSHQQGFGVNLDENQLRALSIYYKLVSESNSLLHLTAPMSAQEFAIRHVLESLAMLNFLPSGAKFADVGAGAGLPSIPCLIIRSDLSACLIESKNKKAGFLITAIERLGLENRAYVINQPFEQIRKPDCQFIACRALDKFAEKLPKLLRWGRGSAFLLFGGENLRQSLLKSKANFTESLLPLSERRFLFFVRET
ncbi:MAG: hypothetical protein D6735_12520 [Acidobacteria bacterium]|nr:MAG: hypothetical protein D6735_12520 [Acidobacteriota bacterium]